MRGRVLIGLILASGLLLLAASFFRPRLSPARPKDAEIASAAAEITPTASVVAASPVPSAKDEAKPLDEDRQQLLEAEVERLEELGQKDDSASLSEILQALTNSEKDIRQAALEAAKQFGNSNAIPAIKAAAESLTDLKEKLAFLEAADFLALPPATFDGPAVVLTPEEQQAQEQRRARHELRRHAQAPIPDPAKP